MLYLMPYLCRILLFYCITKYLEMILQNKLLLDHDLNKIIYVVASLNIICFYMKIIAQIDWLSVSVGVDMNDKSTGNVSGSGSGIGGWFGKVYNGVRRRAQSNETNPSDNTFRSRSKSLEETGDNTAANAISPWLTRDCIQKKDLLRELDSDNKVMELVDIAKEYYSHKLVDIAKELVDIAKEHS